MLWKIKKILSIIFRKSVFVTLALLLQLGWILLLFFNLAKYSYTFALVMEIFAAVIVLAIVNKDMNPAFKLSWTVVILAFPIFGLVNYLMFGGSRIAAWLRDYFKEAGEKCRPYLKTEEEIRRQLKEENPMALRQSDYIEKTSGYPVYKGTDLKYFQVGDDMFPVLIRELEKAEKYIFIEYFIINDGVMWKAVLDVLEEKAAHGVDVRILYDGFGCLTTLPDKYDAYLAGKGIRCAVFNPYRPILSIIQNNRDHRKLCIIDGKVGFTGGINLSDEYINRKKRFGHWKDTAVMLRGDAVRSMTYMFLQTWLVVKGLKSELDLSAYEPVWEEEERAGDNGYVQPFSDTPLERENIGENVYLQIINQAVRYVYICTPYLIIDQEMMNALCLAARSGVDVRIMTPGIPDKKLVFLMTQSYYRQLVESGVQILEYQPGFLHAKTFVCDDAVGVVGTINLDYRSLYLHFEDGVWIYKSRVISEIRDDFLMAQEYCKPVTAEFCRNRSIPVRIFQAIMRLFAPLL